MRALPPPNPLAAGAALLGLLVSFIVRARPDLGHCYGAASYIRDSVGHFSLVMFTEPSCPVGYSAEVRILLTIVGRAKGIDIDGEQEFIELMSWLGLVRS